MTIRTDGMKNVLANAYGAAAPYISLHTADPGTTGASEVAGGGYARQQTTWGAAVAGVIVGSPVVLAIPPSTTVTHLGFWAVGSGGSFRDAVALPVTAQVLPLSVTTTPTYTQT